MNRHDSKRPTLAELWRTLLVFLEDQGVEDAPAKARSLAIAAWTGWDSGVTGSRRGSRTRRRPCTIG
jgi:hypothetical protein